MLTNQVQPSTRSHPQGAPTLRTVDVVALLILLACIGALLHAIAATG